MMEEGSVFHRAQAERAPAFATRPPCLQSQFGRYREIILQHEGFPVNPQSHTGLFSKKLDEESGPAVEDIVGPDDDFAALYEMWASRLGSVYQTAHAYSGTVDQLHPARFGCVFNYNVRGR